MTATSNHPAIHARKIDVLARASSLFLASTTGQLARINGVALVQRVAKAVDRAQEFDRVGGGLHPLVIIPSESELLPLPLRYLSAQPGLPRKAVVPVVPLE
jgi:hypothetical protein